MVTHAHASLDAHRSTPPLPFSHVTDSRPPTGAFSGQGSAVCIRCITPQGRGCDESVLRFAGYDTTNRGGMQQLDRCFYRPRGKTPDVEAMGRKSLFELEGSDSYAPISGAVPLYRSLIPGRRTPRSTLGLDGSSLKSPPVGLTHPGAPSCP